MSGIIHFPSKSRKASQGHRHGSGKRSQTEVARWLVSAGFIEAVWLSPNHVKIDTLNFYVSTGRIHWDNQPATDQRWLEGLRTVLETTNHRALPSVSETLGDAPFDQL